MALAFPVLAAGTPEAGHALAGRWCHSCHGASDAAPPLEAIANRPGTTPSTLRAWLTAPHPPMPDPSLTRGEIDDLVAYLMSLRQQR
jgi:mono/diheme cytochrome c family protein